MKAGFLSESKFNISEDHRFSDNNYVLVTKEEEFPDRNVIPILYRNNQEIFDLDEDFDNNIFTSPNNKMPQIAPLGERFCLHQILKISTGSIIKNNRWTEHSRYPKILTFHTNVNALGINEIIEIFEGEIQESQGKFTLSEMYLNPYITDIFLGTQNCFFILSDQQIMGPFVATRKTSTGSFIIEKSNWCRFGSYHNNEATYIQFEANDIKRRIIIPEINQLEFKDDIEFKTDQEIIDGFRKEIIQNPEDFNLEQIESIFSFIKNKLSVLSITEYGRERERLIKILQQSEQILDINLEFAQILPEINSFREEIDGLKELKLKLIQEISDNQSKLEKIEEEVVIAKEIHHNLEVIPETKPEQISKEIEELRKKKDELAHEIEIERNNLSISLDSLKQEIKDKKIYERQLEDAISLLKKEFLHSEKDVQAVLEKIIVQKKYHDLFMNLPERNVIKEIDNSQLTKYSGESFKDFTDYRDLRNQICSILERHNRKLESHFIDNILISIHQNTLTLFAGLPGTGKTTLARLFTNMLSTKDRVREVSVGRGWSTYKDLIGFSNPLTGKFHSASTNIYSLLKQLDYESKSNCFMEAPLGYVILDEANLSPMEHYWSLFYNLTDKKASEHKKLLLSLGNEEYIEYANNLRFIGTINYDQTTEEISPRIIDRANIIRINPRQFDINILNSVEIDTLGLTFRQCKDFFNLNDFSKDTQNISLDQDESAIYNEVKSLLESINIYISPRVDIAIKKYCSVARQVMHEENKPLDYCIAQRVLPLINTQGANSRTNLIRLSNFFDEKGMSISNRILKSIINIGREGEMFEDNFNYFLTLSHV